MWPSEELRQLFLKQCHGRYRSVTSSAAYAVRACLAKIPYFREIKQHANLGNTRILETKAPKFQAASKFRNTL